MSITPTTPNSPSPTSAPPPPLHELYDASNWESAYRHFDEDAVPQLLLHLQGLQVLRLVTHEVGEEVADRVKCTGLPAGEVETRVEGRACVVEGRQLGARLGDGTVVLILNVPAVVSRLSRATPLGAIA